MSASYRVFGWRQAWMLANGQFFCVGELPRAWRHSNRVSPTLPLSDNESGRSSFETPSFPLHWGTMTSAVDSLPAELIPDATRNPNRADQRGGGRTPRARAGQPGREQNQPHLPPDHRRQSLHLYQHHADRHRLHSHPAGAAEGRADVVRSGDHQRVDRHRAGGDRQTAARPHRPAEPADCRGGARWRNRGGRPWTARRRRSAGGDPGRPDPAGRRGGRRRGDGCRRIAADW